MSASSRSVTFHRHPGQLQYSISLTLWVVFFCYATSAALLFQKFLLPLIPALHAGMGLLDGDSLYFHSVAVELAKNIQLSGWSSWSLYPAPGATGNVAILGALYALFGNYDPVLIIPVNAAIHAFGGILIFKIGQLLVPGKVGRTAGIVTAVLFVGFPSALNWYGQLHKDGFAIAGTLLVIYAWLQARARPDGLRNAATLGLSSVGAVLLIALVRPYNIIPLLAVLLVVFGLMLAVEIPRARMTWRMLCIYALSLAIFAVGAKWATQSGVNDQYVEAKLTTNWQWKATGWLPQSIDQFVEITARTRARLIDSDKAAKAGSTMDADVKPDNALAVVAYAPRAVQIALFAPFPVQWIEKISPARLVSLLETLIWYLLAPGMIFAVIFHRSVAMLMVAAFSLLFLFIYGFALANLGSLYRIRYPYLFLFILIGAVGWVQFWLSRRRQGTHPLSTAPHDSNPGAAENDAHSGQSRGGLFSAGATVAAFTLITYAGLFLRDVILARWFGVRSELDAMFIALAYPTFLIAVFCIPLGTALIPAFLAVRTQQSFAAAQRLVSGISFFYALIVVPVAVILFLFAPGLLMLMAPGFSASTHELSVSLFRWMLPILVLSGLVIIGNSLLNALGKYTIAAAAQLAVPIMSILVFLLLGHQYGIAAAIAGMLAGQMLNLWLVANGLRRHGLALFPHWLAPSRDMREAALQYLPLAAAALFVNMAAPVNIMMASTLAEGSVAALGLGNKVVIFITGIVGAAVATVLLPHFSSFMARKRLLDARNELAFFLLAATVVTIPISLFLFVASDQIVRLAFAGGAVAREDLGAVARVMEYGIIQLPFFTVNLLILKFAVATRHAGRVMLTSLVGLAINVALNLVLMVNSGVAGIALATTLATALATCLLLLFFKREGHISWVTLVMLAQNWMLFTTFVICLHFQSYVGVVVSMVALLVLLYGEWTVLIRRRAAT